MGSDRIDGPDFICIGMAKAGTGWLFDQLNNHPDFWMPPVKGLNYLNRKFPKMKSASKRLLRSSRGKVRAKGRSGSDRDLKFLSAAAACADSPMDLEVYASLFRFKGDRLSGDITPAYAALRESEISRIASHLPDVKIILLVRDPISRAASRISMAYRRGEFDPKVVDNAEEFRDVVATASWLEDERSRPTQIVARWAEMAPNTAFRTFLFDDIEQRPEIARREILVYLGADPSKDSGDLPAGHNHKANAAKLALPPSSKEILIDYFKDEVVACAKLLGGPASTWVSRYGL